MPARKILSPDETSFLKQQYIAGKSTHELARETGLSQEFIRGRLVRGGVVLRPPPIAITLGMLKCWQRRKST